jgi:hypothetical protein
VFELEFEDVLDELFDDVFELEFEDVLDELFDDVFELEFEDVLDELLLDWATWASVAFTAFAASPGVPMAACVATGAPSARAKAVALRRVSRFMIEVLSGWLKGDDVHPPYPNVHGEGLFPSCEKKRAKKTGPVSRACTGVLLWPDQRRRARPRFSASIR